MENKNIFVIPTDKPSRLSDCHDSKLHFDDVRYLRNYKNIYITNNDYIGLSYYLDGDLVRKGVIDDKDYWEVRKDYKKIILTTDPKLIKDGVQSIPDEFIQWFIAKTNDSGKPIDIVGIDKIGLVSDNGRVLYGVKYKIIIPEEAEEKVRPYSAEQYDSEIMPTLKQEPKKDLEKEMFELEQELDIPSNLRWHNSKPEQETVEEAIKREYETRKFNSDFPFDPQSFKLGAKWQQEQDKNKFSEEDMREMYNKSCGQIGLRQLKDQTENNNRFQGFLDKIKKK